MSLAVIGLFHSSARFGGYITNVFAIKMLFWPRQPVKLDFLNCKACYHQNLWHQEIASSIGGLSEE